MARRFVWTVGLLLGLFFARDALAGAKIAIAPLEETAKGYEERLKLRAAGSHGDLAERIAQSRALESAERWDEAIEAVELLAGMMPEGYEVWLRLATLLDRHRPAADMAPAAGYLAYQRAKLPAEEIEALLTLGLTLRNELDRSKRKSDAINEQLRALSWLLQGAPSSGDADYGRNADISFPRSPGQSSAEDQLTPVNERTREARLKELTAEQRQAKIRYGTIVSAAHEVYEELFALLKRKALSDQPVSDPLEQHQRPLVVRGPVWKGDKKAVAACFDFDLELVKTPGIYKSWVTVQRYSETGGPPTLVDAEIIAEGGQLCVHGLAHGQLYSFDLRHGLPVSANIKLTKDRSFERQIAPNLPATVYFRNAAYVVPNNGDMTVPIHTVNLLRLDLELIRISDRNIYRQVALRQIGSNIKSRELEDLYARLSEPIWKGEISLTDRIDNEQRVTHLPIGKLLEERRIWVRQNDNDASRGSKLGRAGGVFSAGEFYRDPVSYQTSGGKLWEPGVYALIAKPPGVRGDRGEQLPMQWFIFTDIGITYMASSAKLYVVARSLRSGARKALTRIQLLASNNRVLAEQLTNDAGVASFDGRLAQGSHGNKLAAILAYDDEERSMPSDFSYVDLLRDALDLSHVGVAGREQPGVLDAMVYTDRGVYRPDRNYPVRATIIVRGGDGRLPDLRAPLRVQLRSGSGAVLGDTKVISPETLKKQFGGETVALEIPNTAPLGTAFVEVQAASSKQPIGRATIQISHIRPDRARLALAREADWQTEVSAAGDLSIKGHAVAQYLHGRKPERGEAPESPVVGANGELEVVVEPAKQVTPQGVRERCYQGFQFAMLDEAFRPQMVRTKVGPSKGDGSLDLSALVTGLLPTSQPLQARVTLSLQDAAGTMAVQTAELPITGRRPLIGLRRGALTPITAGQFDAAIELVTLTANFRPRPEAHLHYRLSRERTEFVWHRSYDSWTFRPDYGNELVTSGETSTSAAGNHACQTGNGRIQLLGLTPGTYVVEARDEADARASIRFTIGATNIDGTHPEPNLVKIFGPERNDGRDADFTPGQPAQFDIETPFDGPVLAAVIEGGDVVQWIEAETVDRAARLRIDPVPKSWAGQGMHLLVSVFRKNANGSETQGPDRAIGALHFTVQRERNHLKVGLQDAPYQISPASGLPIQVAVEDAAGRKLNGKAMVALFVVDEGLINLTNHPTPQPYQYFYGRRRLAFEIHDSYSRLLLRREGGDSARLITRLIYNNYLSDTIIAHAEEVRVATFFDGVASFNIQLADLAKFTGSVRVAAIVWTAEAMGAADKDVVVRDALIANLGLPRFVAPGDRPVLPLMLENIEALDDEYRIKVSGLDIEKVTMPGRTAPEEFREEYRVRLAPGERKQMLLHFSVAAKLTQQSPSITLRITGSNRARNPVEITRIWSIKLRQPFVPVIAQLRQEQLASAGSLKLVLSETEQARLRWPSVQARFSTSNFPVPVALSDARLADEVQQLDRLAWTALLLLHRQRGGRRPDMLERTLADIVALQHRSGGFLDHKLDRSTTEREAVRTIVHGDGGAEDQGFDRNIWRAALATDVLRLAAVGASHPYDREIKAAAEFLRREVGWRRALPVDDVEGNGGTAKSAILAPAPAQGTPSAEEESAQAEEPPPGSLGARFVDVPKETAQRLSLPTNAGALVESVRPTSPASAVGLSKGDVILAVNGEDVEGANWLEKKLHDKGAGANVKFKANKGGQVVELQVTLAMREGRASPCSAGIAYAAYVLVRLESIDLIELKQFAEACASIAPDKRRSAIPKLILAAALKEFGKPELAEPLLASFNSSLRDELAGAPGVDRLEHLGRLLTFVDRAASGTTQVADVLRAIESVLRAGQQISLAANAWFARAALERATQSMVDVQLNPERLETGSIVQEVSRHEVATRFIEARELTSQPVEAKNRSSSPVSATLFIRGWPTAAAPADGRLAVKRRYFRPDGMELTDYDLKVAHNELLFVVVEGRRTAPVGDVAEPDDGGPSLPAEDQLLIIDLLPAGFEIVQPDVYQGTTNGAVLPPGKGKLRHVEMRDDRYIAIVAADKAHDGEFRVAYAARATTTGQFRLSQVRVEELRQPELAADVMEDRSVTIEQR